MLKLKRLFELQDEVLSEHLNKSLFVGRMFDLLSDSLWLNAGVLAALKFEPEKQTAIRRFTCDTLSHVIVAIRVGLWGDLPESLTLLRSALESSTQLLFIVGNRKYKTAVFEMERKFDQVSFERAVAGLGPLGERAKKIHGKISELAAHATAPRMTLVDYDYDGTTYDRVGFARNPQYAEHSLFYCMDASLLVSQALLYALEQDGIPISWQEQMNEINERFESLRSDILAFWKAKGVDDEGPGSRNQSNA